MSRILCIIPARSGSKGVVDKNIKLLNGIPLMAYTIKAALDSKMFEEIIVSTDSQKYSEIAVKYGASVPFLRSKKNSQDNSSTWDSVREVVVELGKRGYIYDTIVVLQPTSPLRKPNSIISALNFYKAKNADFVSSVTEMVHSPLWSNLLPKDYSMKEFIKEEYNLPRQQLPQYYRENGAIYIVNNELLERNINLYSSNSFAYVMSKDESIDIDSEIDFKMAELLMNNIK